MRFLYWLGGVVEACVWGPLLLAVMGVVWCRNRALGWCHPYCRDYERAREHEEPGVWGIVVRCRACGRVRRC